MKQMINKLTYSASIVFLAFIIFSVSGCAKAGFGGPSYAIDGVADGSQVVPTSSSSASGSVTGNFDGGKNTMTGTITWTGLSGAPTAIHIHGGGPGKNGYPAFILVNVPKTATGSLTFTSAFTESEETGVGISGYYFDIHTGAYPNGEIRGQLIAH